jgi:hypothetical protein
MGILVYGRVSAKHEMRDFSADGGLVQTVPATGIYKQQEWTVR